MSRIEENKKLCERFDEMAKETPEGLFPEMVVWMLGAISSYLTDISKSLAVMADKAECQDDDLSKNETVQLCDEICNALNETLETRKGLIRKIKREKLTSLKDEIIECYCRVENDYDHGRNKGLYLATQLIDKHLKEVCE